MMFKSFVATFLLLASLATISTAQGVPPTPTTPTLTTTTTAAVVTGTATGITPTLTTAPTTRPPNNMTFTDFSSLASVIASVATGRSLNPGHSPTPKAGGPNSASRVGAGGKGEVLMGLGLVVLSAVVAGAGTLAL
ncbi:hypothetical protein BG015_005152 [Linnemannia schmuckeri]|uniref:Uncharacterized protein n=1 Tax=Linnemannia schmuckeri TaxID=64567 RepID=A0A9P5S3S9_9FUNG|nr:hypothetical protein BG015_005152 [Linnemannia schmuckeri]